MMTLVAALTLAPAATADTLHRHAALTPVVVHDADERSPLASAAAHAPIARTADARPAAYGRAVPTHGGAWLQYWLYFADQDQDRGVVRAGRHAGDWELVQFRVNASGEPVEAVYAQHSGAERCNWSEVQRRGGRPVVYAAHGSHASYLRSGTRDRMWPDPNDEADGRGTVTRPRLVEITAASPPWMAYPEPWGASRASRFIPIEQDSPHGPAFQPARWDPEAFARGARPCQADCDEVGECDAPEKALTGVALAAALIGAVAWVRRRRSALRGDATASGSEDPRP
jgi:hypothetical protein